MPLKDKELANDQHKKIARAKHRRELLSKQHESGEENEVHYITPKDFNSLKEEEKSQIGNKVKKNHVETIIDNITRLQSNRASFQQRIAAAKQAEHEHSIK